MGPRGKDFRRNDGHAASHIRRVNGMSRTPTPKALAVHLTWHDQHARRRVHGVRARGHGGSKAKTAQSPIGVLADAAASPEQATREYLRQGREPGEEGVAASQAGEAVPGARGCTHSSHSARMMLYAARTMLERERAYEALLAAAVRERQPMAIRQGLEELIVETWRRRCDAEERSRGQPDTRAGAPDSEEYPSYRGKRLLQKGTKAVWPSKPSLSRRSPTSTRA